ncbi:MAG: T9SS type A sorting domain-containing protein [Chitinivibrionales bacterium]|nr:T9SS type A sorting domain-containing protein [Chitinivibrionales bacterium]
MDLEGFPMKCSRKSFPACIVFLLAPVVVLSETYYVATNGSNSSDGSLEHPFRTIQKAADICDAGDVCVIRGGMYHETVTPQHSGSSSNPITYKAYPGERVIISGADTVGGWDHYEGDIYKAPIGWDLGPGLNQVFVDGRMMCEARYPDVAEEFDYNSDGWVTGLGQWDKGEHFRRTQPFDSTPSIIRPVLAYQLQVLSPDGMAHRDSSGYVRVRITHTNPYIHGRADDFWKGAMLWTRGSYYAGGGQIVGSHDDGDFTILYCDVDRIKHEAGFAGFYLSGLMHFLSSPGEWAIVDGELYLHAPGSDNPSTMLVTAKKRHMGFDLSERDYITLENLVFHATSLVMHRSRNCTVDGCHFYCVSHYTGFQWETNARNGGSKEEKLGGNRGIYIGGSGNLFTNSSVRWSAGNGIIMGDTNNVVDNSVVRSCNYSGTYCAGIFLDALNDDDVDPSHGHIITRNTINAMGRSVIHTGGASGDFADITITYNNFYDCVLLNEDGGIIYGAGLCNNNLEIGYNWFRGVYHYNVGYVYLDHGGGNDVHLHHNVFFPNPIKNGTFNPLAMGPSNYYYNNTFAAETYEYDITFSEHWDNLKVEAFGAANNIDASADSADWKFTDPDNGDYTLTENSPARNAGVEIGSFTTREGKVYSSPTEGFAESAPDLGAYEYGKDPWVAGHTWGSPPAIDEIFTITTGSVISSVQSPVVPRLSLKTMGQFLCLDTEGHGTVTVRLFDPRGRTVFSSMVRGSSVIPLPQLGAGAYLVKAGDAKNTLIRKLIIDRR